MGSRTASGSTRRIRSVRRWRAATVRCDRWTCTAAAAATCSGAVSRRPRRRARLGAPPPRRAKGAAGASRWASRTGASSSSTWVARDGTPFSVTATPGRRSRRSGSPTTRRARWSSGRWGRVDCGAGRSSRCLRNGRRGRAAGTRQGRAGYSRTSPTPSAPGPSPLSSGSAGPGSAGPTRSVKLLSLGGSRSDGATGL